MNQISNLVFNRALYNPSSNVPITEEPIERIETTCRVDINGQTFLGSAKCYFKDDDVRYKGRRAAFKDAISSIEDKDIRSQAWNVFKEQN